MLGTTEECLQVTRVFGGPYTDGLFLAGHWVNRLASHFFTHTRLLPNWGPASSRGTEIQLIGFGSITSLHSEGVHVKVIRKGEHAHQLLTARPVSHRNTFFFFYEKISGVAHFHVPAGPDGRLPVEQAAGLLAMHCLVRGQTPSDYAVLVQAENEVLEDLIEKADQLLEAGKSVHGKVRLTRREEEVLAGVSESLSNKEIASNLNLSERTVKFHVSSLLAKFQVRGRMELVRQAARHAMGVVPEPVNVATREPRSFAPPIKSYPAPRRAVAMVPLPKMA